MKDMQHPDMLSVHCSSRKMLWSGGSEILAVGNCQPLSGCSAKNIAALRAGMESEGHFLLEDG